MHSNYSLKNCTFQKSSGSLLPSSWTIQSSSGPRVSHGSLFYVLFSLRRAHYHFSKDHSLLMPLFLTPLNEPYITFSSNDFMGIVILQTNQHSETNCATNSIINLWCFPCSLTTILGHKFWRIHVLSARFWLS